MPDALCILATVMDESYFIMPTPDTRGRYAKWIDAFCEFDLFKLDPWFTADQIVATKQELAVIEDSIRSGMDHFERGFAFLYKHLSTPELMYRVPVYIMVTQGKLITDNKSNH